MNNLHTIYHDLSSGKRTDYAEALREAEEIWAKMKLTPPPVPIGFLMGVFPLPPGIQRLVGYMCEQENTILNIRDIVRRKI